MRSTFGLRGFPSISPRCGSSSAHRLCGRGDLRSLWWWARGGDAVAFGNPHFPSRLYRHAYPYNAGQETSVIEGETLKPRQKAKYRNAYVAPLSLDRTKPNGVGPGVVTIGAR